MDAAHHLVLLACGPRRLSIFAELFSAGVDTVAARAPGDGILFGKVDCRPPRFEPNV
jgi:hypothetical protein